MLVFISGPYTGDELTNTENAMRVGLDLLDLEFSCIVPHLSHFMEQVSSRPYEVWMKNDTEMLRRCDALIRLPGVSPGADKEVNFAREHGIPVFYSVLQLTNYRDQRERGET